MKTRMKRLISLITAAALCLSCIPMSAVYASEEIKTVAEVGQEDLDDGTTTSKAKVQKLTDNEAEFVEFDQAFADKELVSATAPVQASKSSQDGEYVGGATTMQSGPANPREPKIYTLDLNEHNYPLKNANRADYMQGVGILYPGDKLQIIAETDTNPGGDGDHGLPGKILMNDKKEWLDLQKKTRRDRFGLQTLCPWGH